MTTSQIGLDLQHSVGVVVVDCHHHYNYCYSSSCHIIQSLATNCEYFASATHHKTLNL